MPAKLGSIMHLNKPFSSAPLMDIQLDELSNRAIKNSALTTKLKGIVGVEIGPVTVGGGLTSVRIPSSGTNSVIHTNSEIHLFSDNGAGSSNANSQYYDTPIWYTSKTIHEGYFEATFPALPVITDFYLKVINDAF